MSQSPVEPTTQSSDDTLLSGVSSVWLDALYADYRTDPGSVPVEWRHYFERLGEEASADDARAVVSGPSWQRADWPPRVNGEATALLDGDWSALEATLAKKIETRQSGGNADVAPNPAEVHAATKDSIRALMLIRAYRIRGHLKANLDPLGLHAQSDHAELDPAGYGFGPHDYDRPIFIDNVLGLEYATLSEILDILERTYCGTFAVEFMHISDPEQKAWIQQRIEGPDKDISFTKAGKKAILKKLIEAEGFENFLQTKYTGTKRFGLDGGESMVPALEQIIKRGGAMGVSDIIIGMPHRGRLNVLAAVMGKPYHHIFHEFQGGSITPEDVGGSGDVKYHLGASSDRSFDGNDVHLSLTANPSHLEAVNPVVVGKARAKQDLIKRRAHNDDPQRFKVLPLLLHGDAAFAGQGVVAECLGFSGLRGYQAGGTIHFIVNNQIGFTTSPKFARSSPYPSDVAKMIGSPIFHVNGDDPEAVTYAAKIAAEYRQQFGNDVVIDMFCYRRFGHNEGDEPSFTQPLMYKKIKAHQTTCTLYTDRLIAEGIIDEAWADNERQTFRDFLTSEFEAGSNFKPNKADWLDGRWSGYAPPKDDDRRGNTAVEISSLKSIGKVLTQYPPDFNPHRTLKRILKQKADMFDKGASFDWATAEALAFGSLLEDGFDIRLSGQDSRRGTFSQRHAVFIDQGTEDQHIPLETLGGEEATFEVHDSHLSEFGVMGFEYGYSLANPKALVLWEGQFGDFANGAQVIIDQFISTGERKWLRMSGLALFS